MHTTESLRFFIRSAAWYLLFDLCLPCPPGPVPAPALPVRISDSGTQGCILGCLYHSKKQGYEAKRLFFKVRKGALSLLYLPQSPESRLQAFPDKFAGRKNPRPQWPGIRFSDNTGASGIICPYSFFAERGLLQTVPMRAGQFQPIQRQGYYLPFSGNLSGRSASPRLP